MSYIRQWKWTRYVPLCPTFMGYCGRKSQEYELEKDQPQQMNSVSMEKDSNKNNLHHRKVNGDKSDGAATTVI